MKDFAEHYGIKLLTLTPYCAQANEQTEAFNKTLIGILEKMIKKNSREWHRILSETPMGI